MRESDRCVSPPGDRQLHRRSGDRDPATAFCRKSTKRSEAANRRKETARPEVTDSQRLPGLQVRHRWRKSDSPERAQVSISKPQPVFRDDFTPDWRSSGFFSGIRNAFWGLRGTLLSLGSLNDKSCVAQETCQWCEQSCEQRCLYQPLERNRERHSLTVGASRFILGPFQSGSAAV